MKKLFKKAIAMCRDLPLNFVIVELSLYQREDGSSDNIKWISKRILEVTVTDQQWIYHLRMLNLPKLKPMSLASSDCPAREEKASLISIEECQKFTSLVRDKNPFHLGEAAIVPAALLLEKIMEVRNGKIKEIHLTFLSPVRVNQEFLVQVVDNTVIIFQHQILCVRGTYEE